MFQPLLQPLLLEPFFVGGPAIDPRGGGAPAFITGALVTGAFAAGSSAAADSAAGPDGGPSIALSTMLWYDPMTLSDQAMSLRVGGCLEPASRWINSSTNIITHGYLAFLEEENDFVNQTINNLQSAQTIKLCEGYIKEYQTYICYRKCS